jgi:hypothetical protein
MVRVVALEDLADLKGLGKILSLLGIPGLDVDDLFHVERAILSA